MIKALPLKTYAVGVLDLQSGKIVSASKTDALDVWDTLVALEGPAGGLQFTSLSTKETTVISLPPGNLPNPRGKQAVRLIGSFTYHFWMSDMKPTRRRSGNQHLHRESLEYRNAVKRKLHAYHVFIQAGIVCQGLLQYLAVAFPQLVWNSFGSWLRTIRPGIPPSELVVANALRQSLPEYLLITAPSNIFAKFVIQRQDTNKLPASGSPPS